MRDPRSTYIETLTQAFERLKKVLSVKKYKDLCSMVTSAIQQVPTDEELDANKYFIIFKLALDTRITRVLEIALYFMQKLISHGFMTGNAPDNCTENPQFVSPRHPRKLIDAIMESVCFCMNERDDNVQL